MDTEEDDGIDSAHDIPSARGNTVPLILLFSKTVIGAGVAALPLTDAALGWPLATLLLLLVAVTTKWSLDIIVRAGHLTNSLSYTEIVRKSLHPCCVVLLDISIIAFGLGLMLVYSVVIGDMLVGQGGDGLVCAKVGGLACSRPFIVALVTVLILFPLISVRNIESLAFAGWIGIGALLLWAIATVILVIVAISNGSIQPVQWKPDPVKLGKTGFQKFATICSVVPTLTTAYSCQAAGMFALSALRPGTPQQKHLVTFAGITITTIIYVLIAIGSYLLFGQHVKPDVLQNFTVENLHRILPVQIGWIIYVAVRLSFLAGVLTLYPLMMFPTRDGLLRLLQSNRPSRPITQHKVTYVLCIAIYAVSVITPSIKGPIEVIGATAGAAIGFIIPGLLAFRGQGNPRDDFLLADLQEGSNESPWGMKSGKGWLLLTIGIIQCITGVAAEMISAIM